MNYKNSNELLKEIKQLKREINTTENLKAFKIKVRYIKSIYKSYKNKDKGYVQDPLYSIVLYSINELLNLIERRVSLNGN